MSSDSRTETSTNERNPWAAPRQVLEGPGHLPRSPREEAMESAADHERAVQRVRDLRAMDAEAQHQYEVHQQRAELDALRRREARVEDRMARNGRQLHDGAVGALATFGLGRLLISNAKVDGGSGLWLNIALGGLSLYAGSQCMDWRYEQRQAKYEDELDRVQERIAKKRYRRPRPFDAWGLDLV